MINIPDTSLVKTESQLRALMGEPSELVQRKVITRLDEHCVAFIKQSPFMLMSTSDAAGNCDVSPKGDPPGFAHVYDAQHLLIPDRPGNRRIDTLRNIIQNPHVGLLFLIPGKQETLRVNGSAVITRDETLRALMPVHGRVPELVIAVTVEEAFLHCAKCMVRSELWNPAHWPDLAGTPSIAHALRDHSGTSRTVEDLQAALASDTKNKLY